MPLRRRSTTSSRRWRLRLQELRTAQREAEGRWGALLSVLPAGDVDEIDSAFRTLAKVRADLAATEERQVELGDLA